MYDRYIMVLMGFFATYAGLLYNDCFGLGLKLFTPTWELPTDDQIGKFYLNKTAGDPVYAIGVDPTWHLATNDLLFFNSLKMKMAIIFGVTQMTFGIGLKILNAMRWKPKRKGEWNLDLWFEAIPQLIFMVSLFGYMCFLILLKWSLPWDSECGRDNCEPPSLITILINIGLSPGGLLKNQVLFTGQNGVQVLLLLIAVAQVPVMLVVKPYILIKRMRNAEITHHGGGGQHVNGAGMSGSDIGGGGAVEFGAGTGSLRGPPFGGGSMEGLERTLSSQSSTASVSHEETSLIKGGGGGGDHHTDDHGDEEHGVGDIVIHQAIETIEFCLGCISNTASYLRLWALSLAHSQLAIVFWEMTLLQNLKSDSAFGVIACFIGYAVLAGATIGVLLCMDNLECFLHSLRLHWVEFQDKFYNGDGILFTPLSFKSTLAEEVEK
jgi:V-type H+-transporting ATPase subunit a